MWLVPLQQQRRVLVPVVRVLELALRVMMRRGDTARTAAPKQYVTTD
jgi:hypothetical protein